MVVADQLWALVVGVDDESPAGLDGCRTKCSFLCEKSRLLEGGEVVALL